MLKNSINLLILCFFLQTAEASQCFHVFSHRTQSAQRMQTIVADGLTARKLTNISGYEFALIFADKNSDFYTPPIVRQINPQSAQVVYKRKTFKEQNPERFPKLPVLERTSEIAAHFKTKPRIVESIKAHGHNSKQSAEILYLRDQVSEYVAQVFYNGEGHFVDAKAFITTHRIPVEQAIAIYDKQTSVYQTIELVKNHIFENQAPVNVELMQLLEQGLLMPLAFNKKRGQIISELLDNYSR